MPQPRGRPEIRQESRAMEALAVPGLELSTFQLPAATPLRKPQGPVAEFDADFLSP